MLDDIHAEPYLGLLTALKRAIANLIDNAVKYGHGAQVSVEEDAAGLRIVVEANGPGIPESDLVRVVEPYVRLETSRSRDIGGVGLGLAIARDAVRLHGGELILGNRPEGGMEARVYLPRKSNP